MAIPAPTTNASGSKSDRLWSGLSLRFMLPMLLLLFGLALIGFESLVFSKADADRAVDATISRCERSGARILRIVRASLERHELHLIHTELKYADEEDGVDSAVLVDRSLTVATASDAKVAGQSAEVLLSPNALLIARRAFENGERIVEVSADRQSVIGAFLLNESEQVPPHALVLEIDLKKPLRDATHTAAMHAVISAVVLLFACALLWLVLDRIITRRVTRVLLEARAITAGPLPDMPLDGTDELAQIAKALRETHITINDQAAGLRGREQRHRLMVESLPAMVFVTRDGRIEFMNDTGIRMLGAKGFDEIKGTSPFDFILPQYHDAIKIRVRDIMRTGQSSVPTEEEIVRRDGYTLTVETVASGFVDERGSAIQVVMHDISERKAAEARREALGRDISNASEREQRRIGQDLHDDICQRLAAVKMNMQDLEESLAEHAPALMDEADAIVDRLTDAIRITRGLARGLSPVDIEAGGLGVALTGLVRSAAELLQIECKLSLPDDLPSLPPHAATQFYRIAQECITNGAKHGLAKQVWVQLREVGDALIMRVCNDGKLFNPSATDSQGMGLHIMKHRAESMGATLEFESKPADASVAVCCRLPLAAIRKSQLS